MTVAVRCRSCGEIKAVIASMGGETHGYVCITAGCSNVTPAPVSFEDWVAYRTTSYGYFNTSLVSEHSVWVRSSDGDHTGGAEILGCEVCSALIADAVEHLRWHWNQGWRPDDLNEVTPTTLKNG